MKVLSFARKAWRYIGLYSEGDDSFQFQIVSFAIFLFLFSGVQCLLWLSLHHLYTEHERTDSSSSQNIELKFYVAMQIVFALSATFPLIHFHFRKKELRDLSLSIQRIVEESKYSASF